MLSDKKYLIRLAVYSFQKLTFCQAMTTNDVLTWGVRQVYFPWFRIAPIEADEPAPC